MSHGIRIAADHLPALERRIILQDTEPHGGGQHTTLAFLCKWLEHPHKTPAIPDPDGRRCSAMPHPWNSSTEGFIKPGWKAVTQLH